MYTYWSKPETDYQGNPQEPFNNFILYPQLEVGDTMTEWAEYGGAVTETKNYIEDFSTVKVSVNGKEYTPSSDGMLEGIESSSPDMEIATDSEYANIVEFTYCVDTKAYIDNTAGDIEAALDSIIEIQQGLIGGDAQ